MNVFCLFENRFREAIPSFVNRHSILVRQEDSALRTLIRPIQRPGHPWTNLSCGLSKVKNRKQALIISGLTVIYKDYTFGKESITSIEI
jgi:hypothetical protein